MQPGESPSEGRIREHPILKFERGKPVSITFNGREIKAHEGEPVAAALVAAGVDVLTRSFKYHRPRGFFCAIGKCSSCVLRINGIPNVKACVTQVEEGMKVETQRGFPSTNHDLLSLFDKVPIPAGFYWHKFTNRLSWSVARPFIRSIVGITKLTEVRPDAKTFLPSESREVDLAIVGGGPAGISAALYASRFGAKVALIDDNPKIGGQLVKQTHKFFGSIEYYAGTRGIELARIMRDEVEKEDKVEALTNSTVVGAYGKNLIAVVQRKGSRDERLIKIRTKRLIIGTGGRERTLIFENNDLPGVMGAGGVQTLMNIYGINPGRDAIIVGAGNVGLILAYQMTQAGISVKAVVEAMPQFGGYYVHAAKTVRLGISLLTSHTILKALGKKRAEGALIAKVDEQFRPVKGTERKIDADLIAIAVGFNPDCDLAIQAGAKVKYVSELGGLVPLHDKFQETSEEGLYVTGDAAGIEEATSAILQGRIAGLSAAVSLGLGGKEAIGLRETLVKALDEFRSNPFGEKIKKGKEKALLVR